MRRKIYRAYATKGRNTSLQDKTGHPPITPGSLVSCERPKNCVRSLICSAHCAQPFSCIMELSLLVDRQCQLAVAFHENRKLPRRRKRKYRYMSSATVSFGSAKSLSCSKDPLASQAWDVTKLSKRNILCLWNGSKKTKCLFSLISAPIGPAKLIC